MVDRNFRNLECCSIEEINLNEPVWSFVTVTRVVSLLTSNKLNIYKYYLQTKTFIEPYSALLNSVDGGKGTLQFSTFCRSWDVFKGPGAISPELIDLNPSSFSKILTLMYSSKMLGCVSLKNFGFEHSKNQIGRGDTTDF